jgi:uncharacterized protein (DUF2147 family)
MSCPSKDGKTYDKLMSVSCLQCLLFGWLAGFGSTAFSAAQAASPIGLWKGSDAIFEMFESEGRLSGKIVALSEPTTAEGKAKTDIFNPDPTKRNYPIVGLIFITGLTKKSENVWENGTVYDPTSGKSYSCFLELQEPDRMTVRGFIGLAAFGRTYTWTRAN